MKKLLMVLVLLGLFVPLAFAASLDDPIQPQTPTIGSELQAGYNYASTTFRNYKLPAIGYYEGMNDTANQIARDKSQAYQLGYYFGFRYLILLNLPDDKNTWMVEIYTRKQIEPLMTSLGVDTHQICDCFNIKYDDYINLDKHNK